jgi:hypothetical protein
VRAERVVGWVAWRSGQSERLREMTAGELLAGFDVGRVLAERVVLKDADLAWLH